MLSTFASLSVNSSEAFRRPSRQALRCGSGGHGNPVLLSTFATLSVNSAKHQAIRSLSHYYFPTWYAIVFSIHTCAFDLFQFARIEVRR